MLNVTNFRPQEWSPGQLTEDYFKPIGADSEEALMQEVSYTCNKNPKKNWHAGEHINPKLFQMKLRACFPEISSALSLKGKKVTHKKSHSFVRKRVCELQKRARKSCPSTVQISDLPPELKEMIFSLLNIESFIKCSLISKEWKAITDSIARDNPQLLISLNIKRRLCSFNYLDIKVFQNYDFWDYSKYAYSFAFGEGKLFASFVNGRIKSWDIETGECLLNFKRNIEFCLTDLTYVDGELFSMENGQIQKSPGMQTQVNCYAL